MVSETLLDAGDYVVKSKTCSTDIEITFTNDELFDSFKRVLLQRYSSLQWSKFQHRDCTNIPLDSGRTATVHMWEEDKRSVWLSGDGNQEWYNKEFQQLHADAVVGKVPSGIYASSFVTLSTKLATCYLSFHHHISVRSSDRRPVLDHFYFRFPPS